MPFDLRVRRAARALLLGASLLLVGCALLGESKPPPPPFTPEQRAFMRKVASFPRRGEARKQFLRDSQVPTIGPRPMQLREAAVVETIPLSQGLLFGCETIVLDIPVTDAIRKAVAATGSGARLLQIPTADMAKWIADKNAARLRVEGVDYYVGGRCAIVRVSIHQGRKYGYDLPMFFVYDEGQWTLPTPEQIHAVTGEQARTAPPKRPGTRVSEPTAAAAK